MSQRRALLITPAFSLWDDSDILGGRGAALTPSDTWSGGLGSLLDRVGVHFKDEGVVLLDQAATRALGLPTAGAEVGKVVNGLDAARTAGWKLSDPREGWTTATAEGKPTIVLGLQALIDPTRCLLFNPLVQLDRVFTVGMWQELTGKAWRGTPGVAGMVLMRATAAEYEVRGRKVRPTWRADAGPVGAVEKPWEHKNRFQREQTTAYAHSYDGTRMYLAAAGTCETLSPWALKHSGKQAFNPKLAGWWKLALSPWNDDRLPNPAGPGDDGTRWVTTPTAALLAELTEQGVYGGFEVIDSWTNVGKRPLRRWAETIENAYQTAAERAAEVDPDGTPTSRAQDAERVRRAAKEVYREAWGLLNSSPNSVYRPDWHYTILAQARATLWRKLWRVGMTEDRWPVEIDVDNAWYGSDLADPEQARPAGLAGTDREGRTDRLGTFKNKNDSRTSRGTK